MLIEINGVNVDFPFDPYPLQKDYMEKVIEALQKNENAVLESPTGTGKTLCLLTSTLAWLIQKRSEMISNYKQKFQSQIKAIGQKLDMAQPLDENFGMNQDSDSSTAWGPRYKVVYTSRTHSQLAQAMKELKFTEYRHLRAVALGGRDQLCINEEVLKEATTSSEKIHLCRAKIKAKQCSYHSRVEKALEGPEVNNQSVLDIEDLVKVGKSCRACPYYMSKQLSGQADIVFLPYNYVLDPKLLKSFKLELSNSVVILDEAHNVEKVCQDAASVQIASSDIATCIDDVTHVMKLLDENERLVPTGDEEAPDFNLEDCAMLKGIMLELEKQVDSIGQVSSQGKTLPGGKIFDYLSGANITQESFAMVVKLTDTLVEFLQQASAGKAFGRKGGGLSKVSEFLSVVYGSMTSNFDLWRQTMERGYRLHVEVEEQKKKWGGKSSDGWMNTSVQQTINNNAKILNYWCFNPGFGMAQLIQKNVHSIILTSGTLAPLKPLISELALDVDHQLENPHIIKPTQVLAKIISQGPDGTPLNCGFNNRDNPKYIHSLALTIKTVASCTPNGLLVFFPSYVLMNKAQEAWKNSGMWSAINEVKPIFTEPKGKDEFDECINDYYSAVETSRGAIFMAVLRGKVSEGLDFKDKNGRAVIIIGLPFPPYMDPRVVLKKEYLDKNRTKENKLAGSQEWYNTEATKAVNQAIGRVIRHKDDFGAILLCDQRFQNYKAGLSKWIQVHITQPSGGKFVFGAVIRELNQFFRNASTSLPIPVKREIKEEVEAEDPLPARAKSERIMKQQIKIENSNEIYGSSSKSAFMDSKAIEAFIKKEDKPKSFMGGLSKDVTTIDFNVVEPFTPSTSSQLKPSNRSPEEYESASKKRKLKMVPNEPSSQDVSFVMVMEPVRVKREVYEKEIPGERQEFLKLIKLSLEIPHYKYLLSSIADYSKSKDFTSLWRRIMPMFKYHCTLVFLLRGLRNFITTNHKTLFDAEMKKHFIVD